VHGLLSSVATGEPAVQAPDRHVSEVVQALPSVHVVPSGLAGSEQAPEVGSQVPAMWHWSLATQVTGVPATQVPVELHVSAPLQALPSGQLVPAATGVCETPDMGSHASVVQGLVSSVATGPPAAHEPD